MKLTKKDKVVYTLIIILGILAFIVSTVLLMRTEKAEAANQTFEFKHFSGMITETLPDDKPFYFWALDAGEYGETYFDLFYEFSNIPKARWWGSNYPLDINWNIPSRTFAASYNNLTWTEGSYMVKLKDSTSYYSNFDLYTVEGQLIYPANPYIPAPSYSYSSAGPYAYFPNIYLSDNKAVFDVKGDVVSDFMEMDVTFNIKLPARSYNGKSLGQYFKDLLNNPSAGSGTYDIKKNLQFFPAVSVKLERVPLEKNEKTGEWRISWSFLELFEVLETLIDEPLHTRYGITENEMDSIIGKWILAQSYCETIETVIYNKDVTNSVWITGPLAISRYGLDGILTLGYKVEKESSEVLTSDKINAENNALQDMLQGKDSEIEDLKTQINHISDYGLVGMDNWNETNVWKTFKSLSSGLLDIGPAFLSISSTVGCVFAFLPGEIQGVIYFGFLAFIVIAIIKVLRG